MAKNDPQFRLRIPQDLKSRIEATAIKNDRSYNAEILETLERAYPDDDQELDEAYRVIRGRIETAGDSPDPRLVRLAQDLLIQRWFEPVGDDEE